MRRPDSLYRRMEGQGPWLHEPRPNPRKTGPKVAIFIGAMLGLLAFAAAFASPAPAEFVPGLGFDICMERGC